MRSEPLLFLCAFLEKFLFSLESEANLGICHGVVVLLQGTVVDEGILCEDGEVLANMEVETSLVLSLHHVHVTIRLVHVVTSLDVYLVALW